MIYTVNKITIAATMMATTTVFTAQTVQEGIDLVDSHKYKRARAVFEKLIEANPKDGNNYFHMGNSYLSQPEPNFTKANEYFKRGLSVVPNSNLNKIGIASIKLGNGDKSGIADIQKIVSDTKEKDAEVLLYAAKALSMFEKNNAPDLAISYFQKGIERTKGGVSADVFYTMGDAYRLKKDAGNAMNSYDKALAIAKNKASVYTRMATLWMAANEWKLADENIKKAIAANPSYAPVYKAQTAYQMRFQENAKATEALENYAKYADEDPDVQLEISKLYFINGDYQKAQNMLSMIFDSMEDPIKYKLRAYNEYKLGGNIAQAQSDLEIFKNSVNDKSRIQPADIALEGLLMASVAKKETDATKKSAMMAEAAQKIQVAKNAKDHTLDWDVEMVKINGGEVTQEMADAGPSSPKIQELKSKLNANPKDANLLVELGTAYQEVSNWDGAVLTWDKMIALSPEWTYSYYAKASAYQQQDKHDLAEMTYQKFIDATTAKPVSEQEPLKEPLSYAYYVLAHYLQTKNLNLAKEYAAKSVQLNPSYQDAVKFNEMIQKK